MAQINKETAVKINETAIPIEPSSHFLKSLLERWLNIKLGQ